MSSGDPQRDALVESAIAGDRGAVRELLMEYSPRLRRHLSQIFPTALRGQIDVDDVLQQTYVKAFEQVRQLRSATSSAFGSWLRTIAERQLWDLLKAARAAKRGGGRRVVPLGFASGSVEMLAAALADDAPSPSSLAVHDENVDQMQIALAELKPEYRTVLALRYLQGLSVAETAKRLELTAGAVKMRSARALAAMRELLGSSTSFFSYSC